MRDKEQVASLELCRRLQALDVKETSLLYWSVGEMFTTVEPVVPYHTKEPYIRAYTSGELGQMLPLGTTTWRQQNGPKKEIWKCESEYYGVIFEDEKEANARAKMLIYLLDNKLL